MTVKLNLGCGEDRMPVEDGWINLDLREDIDADMVAPAYPLVAFEDRTVDEIRALDLLEHFWRDDVDDVLAEWRRVLRPGGLLTLRVPNLLALSQQLVDCHDVELTQVPGRVDDTIENIYGGHRWGEGGSLDRHEWGYTPLSLERRLEHNGFVILSNDRRHNMTVVAQR